MVVISSCEDAAEQVAAIKSAAARRKVLQESEGEPSTPSFAAATGYCWSRRHYWRYSPLPGAHHSRARTCWQRCDTAATSFSCVMRVRRAPVPMPPRRIPITRGMNGNSMRPVAPQHVRWEKHSGGCEYRSGKCCRVLPIGRSRRYGSPPSGQRSPMSSWATQGMARQMQGRARRVAARQGHPSAQGRHEHVDRHPRAQHQGGLPHRKFGPDGRRGANFPPGRLRRWVLHRPREN